MSIWRRALADRRGAAAAELGLILPLLLAIFFGSVELGNYFYSEHKLVKGVRDGARYAARQRFSNYSTCSGSPTAPIPAETQRLVQKGTLDSTAPDLLPNWDSATFSVTISCTTTLDDDAAATEFNVSGIYSNNSGGAPSIVVSASVPYRPVLGTPFGFFGTGLSLNASQSAAVAGL